MGNPTGCFILLAAALFVSAARAGESDASQAAPDSPTARALIELFATGYGRGPNSLKESRRLYESARDAAKGSDKVEYAFGLVLLKQLRNKDALSQFQTVTRQTPDFLPAWQAMIWMHFVSKEYPQGYERIKEFAKRLTDAKSRVDLADRQASAEWIGQVVAALQKSADTVKQREASLREDEALKEILGADLQTAFEAGKNSVHLLHATLEDDVQQSREQAVAKQEKDRADKQTQVAKDLESSAERREALKKSAEEQKKYLTEQLAGFDKQLTRLEKDYDFLQKRNLALTATQLELNTEMELLTQQTTGNARPAPAVAQAMEQRKAAIGIQLLKAQVELDQTMVAAMGVSQKAQILIDQRNTTVRQFERATGQLVEQDAALNKWQDRLKKDGEKLKKPSTGKTASVASKVQQARSFRTYVDLDLNLERDRLLETCGVIPSEKNPDK